MRITGGNLKGRKVISGFAKHVRPSTDFMRESMFNVIQHRYQIEEASILDLFSGSGIVSLEFLSREAASVLSVDKDKKNITAQNWVKNEFKLENWEIDMDDAFKFLRNNDNLKFDYIFADPPYDLPNIIELPMLSLSLLNEGGVFILEHRQGLQFQVLPLFQKKYGDTLLSFFENQ